MLKRRTLENQIARNEQKCKTLQNRQFDDILNAKFGFGGEKSLIN